MVYFPKPATEEQRLTVRKIKGLVDPSNSSHAPFMSGKVCVHPHALLHGKNGLKESWSGKDKRWKDYLLFIYGKTQRQRKLSSRSRWRQL